MNTNRISWKLVLPLAGLVLAALACALPAGLGDGSFTDDFSSADSGWGTGTDEKSAVEYQDGGLHFEVFSDSYFTWTNPNDEVYENIHLEVTVKNNSTDPLAVFGVICHQQVTDSMYYFAVTPGGNYAIVKSPLARDEEILTGAGEWAISDAIAVEAASYRLGADCGSNGALTLYVDGKQIDSVTDTDFTKGMVGLFAWSATTPNVTDFTFDDFALTRLK